MINVVGVTFRNEGKITYYDPNQLEMGVGAHVLVNTDRGLYYATVVMPPKEVDDRHVRLPLYKVERVATEEDDRTNHENCLKEKEAYRICREKIAFHGLEMKLVDVEYMFDRSKVIFYFTADGRVDFRELIKDLASIFRTRIELRQIGVRDETKLVGGFGICGRALCCNMYMNEFAPVSIKMAKEQNLSLNPTKISGACGRLMCCLKNEQETYEYLNSRLPNIGSFVSTPEGLKGEVSSVSVLRQRVKVLVEVDDEKEMREYAVEELSFRSKKRDNEFSDEEKEQFKEEGFVPGAPEGGEEVSSDGAKSGESKNNRKPKFDRNKNGHYDQKDAVSTGAFDKDKKESRDSKDGKENRENRENKDNRDGKEYRDIRESGDNKEFHDGKEFRNGRDKKEFGDGREFKENAREGRDNRYSRDRRNNKDFKYNKDNKASHGDENAGVKTENRKDGNFEGQKKEGYSKERTKDFVRDQNKDKNLDKNHYRDKNQEQGKNYHNKNYKNHNKFYNKKGSGANGGGHKDGGNES